MALYETMFSQFNIPTSQLLFTTFDFASRESSRNVHVINGFDLNVLNDESLTHHPFLHAFRESSSSCYVAESSLC